MRRCRGRSPSPRPCPTWCAIGHDVEPDGPDLRLHARELWQASRGDDTELHLASVSVIATDNLCDGERSSTTLSVVVSDCINPAEARSLALALLEGSDYLEAADRNAPS